MSPDPELDKAITAMIDGATADNPNLDGIDVYNGEDCEACNDDGLCAYHAGLEVGHGLAVLQAKHAWRHP